MHKILFFELKKINLKFGLRYCTSNELIFHNSDFEANMLHLYLRWNPPLRKRALGSSEPASKNQARVVDLLIKKGAIVVQVS